MDPPAKSPNADSFLLYVAAEKVSINQKCYVISSWTSTLTHFYGLLMWGVVTVSILNLDLSPWWRCLFQQRSLCLENQLLFAWKTVSLRYFRANNNPLNSAIQPIFFGAERFNLLKSVEKPGKKLQHFVQEKFKLFSKVSPEFLGTLCM